MIRLGGLASMRLYHELDRWTVENRSCIGVSDSH